MDQEHKNKTIEFFSHDYRNITEKGLSDMFNDFTESLLCEHECNSNCRKNGCNCACGNSHF